MQGTCIVLVNCIPKMWYSRFINRSLPRRYSDKDCATHHTKGVEIPVQVIFQTIESLHEACPTNTGDWYFTGNYPTPGGNRVVNKAFMNYMEGKNVRGY